MGYLFRDGEVDSICDDCGIIIKKNIGPQKTIPTRTICEACYNKIVEENNLYHIKAETISDTRFEYRIWAKNADEATERMMYRFPDIETFIMIKQVPDEVIKEWRKAGYRPLL